MCKKYQKLERLIEKNGYQLKSAKNHLIYSKPNSPNISLPKRKTREISLNTLGKILKSLNLTINEFNQL